MEDDSIFNVLQQLYSDGTKQIEYNKPGDIGAAIEKEFEERSGILSDEEKKLAHKYLSDDFFSCQKEAFDFLNIAYATNSKRKRYNLVLKQSILFTKKAEISLKRAIKIVPEFGEFKGNVNYSTAQNQLNDLKKQWHFFMEYPEIAKGITPLYFNMKFAAANGNYDKAALIRDQIESIIALVNKEFADSFKIKKDKSGAETLYSSWKE